MLEQRIKQKVRDVLDFPKPGITFKDLTPLLQDHLLCRDMVKAMTNIATRLEVDAIVGVESRGFWFGLPLAMELGVPFIPIRKKGKLPGSTIEFEYDLEYGSAIIEMHTDALAPGQRVLIHDDLLATGGTAMASAELVSMAGAEVAGFLFIAELSFLNGRSRLLSCSENIANLARW